MGNPYASRRDKPVLRLALDAIVSAWSDAWAAVARLFIAARRRKWLCGLILVGAVLIAFGPAWSAGFVTGDLSLTNGLLVSASNGLGRIWFSLDAPSPYVPLTYTTFYIEHRLWGLNPGGYHLGNLLLQGANAVLLWRLLARLALPGAWLAAALFAIHPVQVESVVWISQRANLLMVFFFLLTLRWWVDFLEDGGPRRGLFYGLALLSFVLALLAEPTACVLPVALLLIVWWQKKPLGPACLAQVTPFFFVGLMAGLFALWVEQNHAGVQGKPVGLVPMERLLVASRAMWFYLGNLLWPLKLSCSYPRWAIPASRPGAYGWLAAALGLGPALLLARRRMGRGPEVAVIFFATALGPLLGFFMVDAFAFSFVADHYQYLACIGPMALAAAGVAWLLARAPWGHPFLELAVGLTVLVALGALTWRQAGHYADAETLWRVTLGQNPHSSLAQINLGKVLLDEGEAETARAHFQKAVALDPSQPCAHDELGVALARLGRTGEAIAEYEEALALDPKLARAQEDLGAALFLKKDLDQAIVHLQAALRLNPLLTGAHNLLGIALANKGRAAAAVAQFEQAVENNPGDTEARSNLGMALAQSGQVKQALAQFQKILEREPDQAQACNNLAWLLATTSDASLRDGRRALELSRHAAELGSRDNPVILHTLAAAYAETGDYAAARTTARHALELAVAETNNVMAGKLRQEIKLYESGSPARTALSP